MNITRLTGRLLLSCSLAVSAVVCGQLGLRAETTTTMPAATTPATATLQTANTGVQLTAQQTQAFDSQALPKLTAFNDRGVTPEPTTLALAAALEPAVQAATRSPEIQSPAVQSSAIQSPELQSSQDVSSSAKTLATNDTAPTVPTPGTVATSAEAFNTEAETPTVAPQPPVQSTAPAIAQTDITPGRATRSGPSYVGLGLNIGAIGRTPLGNFSGAILSKIGLTRLISVRPAVLIDGDATFLFPITLDFPFERAGRVSFAPYVGVGASFSTGDRKNADLIVSGGVDIPLSSQFTLTAGANAGLINGVELGVLVGIGYTFAGF